MNQMRHIHWVVAMIAVAAVAIAGCSRSASAPTSFETYTAQDGSFQCQYPEGWNVMGGGRGVLHTVTFSKGGASIEITASLMGGLMGGISRSVSRVGGFGNADDDSPVLGLHERGKERIASEMKNYVEQPSERIRPTFGRGRRSEFTASKIFGRKTHGYRVTVLGLEKSVTLICKASEGQWKTLKPAFNTVINSLAGGKKR